jgi:hypothetical protein
MSHQADANKLLQRILDMIQDDVASLQKGEEIGPVQYANILSIYGRTVLAVSDAQTKNTDRRSRKLSSLSTAELKKMVETDDLSAAEELLKP